MVSKVLETHSTALIQVAILALGMAMPFSVADGAAWICPAFFATTSDRWNISMEQWLYGGRVPAMPEGVSIGNQEIAAFNRTDVELYNAWLAREIRSRNETTRLRGVTQPDSFGFIRPEGAYLIIASPLWRQLKNHELRVLLHIAFFVVVQEGDRASLERDIVARFTRSQVSLWNQIVPTHSIDLHIFRTH